MPNHASALQKASAKGKAPSGSPEAQSLPPASVATVVPANPSIRSVSLPGTAELSWSTIELGPELPMAVFTSMERWHPERIGAVAIYCSDGRWGEAFDEFCHKHLQIPRYDRLALPGGPVSFLARDQKSTALDTAAYEQLDFLVKAHDLKRIVLITHYGCAAYAERLQRKPDECLPTQMEDLRRLIEPLRRRFANIQVEAYLAMQRGSVLSFHALVS
jgi:hypothetical protein